MRFVSAAIIVFLASSCTSDRDSLRIIETYEIHKNAHDTEQTLALFAEDAVLDFGPIGTVTGHAAIARIHEYDIALQTRLEIEECGVDGESVVCQITETNKWLTTAGIDSIFFPEARFAIDTDGRIYSIAAIPSAESMSALGAAMASFATWAKANAPDRFAALFDAQGNFAFSYDNGNKVLRLLAEWRDSAPLP